MGWLDTLWEAISGQFSPDPPANPVQACPNGSCAITPERAQEVFDALAANPNIPFDYPPDCCYARATEMVRMMDAMGVESGKVWTYAQPGKALVPMTSRNQPVRFPPSRRGEQVMWGYHVAPTVDVIQPNGSVRKMVMDPSLTNGPVTIEEWNRIMSGSGSGISHTATTGNDVWFRSAEGRTYPVPSGEPQAAMAGHIVTRDAALRP